MRWFVAMATFVLVSCATTVRAELPLLTFGQLQTDAAHIVLGKVQRVYTAEKTVDKGYVDTLYAVEVVVSTVEKGSAVRPDQSLFAKAWRMKKRPKDWAGPSGQADIPSPGDVVKLYLAGGNGSFEALLPNGISIVKKKGE